MKKILKKKYIEKIFLLLIFSLSTAFFIYYNTKRWSWDFSVYYLNAKYLFDEGYYFELLRPPLTSFLIGIFGILNWNYATYFYIVFVSLLYFFACKKFSEKYLKNFFVFYLLMLNPFVLKYGLYYGTELLSLALILLSFAFYENALFSGFLFSLACLTRYQNIILLPVFFIRKDFIKNFHFLVCFFITFLPWLIFNFMFKGHMLSSLGNFYALNVKFREYIKQEINISHFFLSFNYLLPLFLLGIKRKMSKKIDLLTFRIIVLFFIVIFSYFVAKIRSERFLFNLILPICYFSFFAGISLKKSFKSAIIILTLFFIICQFLNVKKYEVKMPKLDECGIVSNIWVYFNYKGFKAEPVRCELIGEKIKDGYNILLYKKEYDNCKGFYEKFKDFIVEENNEYVWLRDFKRCKKIKKIDSTYLERLEKVIGEKYNPCEILLPKTICRIFTFL